MEMNLNAFTQFLKDAGKSERTSSGYIADLGIFALLV